MIQSQLRSTVLYITSIQYTDQIPSLSILDSVVSVQQFLVVKPKHFWCSHLMKLVSLVHKHTQSLYK